MTEPELNEWFARFEAEWQARTRLDFLWDQLAANATPRQKRLFEVACCRSRWHLLDEQGRQVAEIAERYTDGSASPDELAAAAVIARDLRSRQGDRAHGHLLAACYSDEEQKAAW